MTKTFHKPLTNNLLSGNINLSLTLANSQAILNQQRILITGPARSGKSEWAEQLAKNSAKSVIYIATATVDTSDSEWVTRIEKHRQRRPASWTTKEVPFELSAALRLLAVPENCLLIDSLGTWVANLLELDQNSWENILKELIVTTSSIQGQVIFVVEETGWGVVPAYPSGRLFRDRLGNLSRQLGAIADTVYLLTCGHILNLSLLGHTLPPSQ